VLDWWHSLTVVNRAFFSAAAFFSVFFLWQMIAAMLGLAGDHDVDAGDADSGFDGHDGHTDSFDADAEVDSTATMVAFKLMSLRAIITFCMLFTWGTALYLSQEVPLAKAMGISSLWGLAGMICIALLLTMLMKLAETGTKRIATAVGNQGTVYLDIPPEGQGEIRVTVSGVVSFVKARSVDGAPLNAGTPIVVDKILDESTVVVKKA
jgi:hypothetical protein